MRLSRPVDRFYPGGRCFRRGHEHRVLCRPPGLVCGNRAVPGRGPVTERAVTAAPVPVCRACHRGPRWRPAKPHPLTIMPAPRPDVADPQLAGRAPRAAACRRLPLASRPCRHPRRPAPRHGPWWHRPSRRRPSAWRPPPVRAGRGTACGRCARVGCRCPARHPGCAWCARAPRARVTRAASSASCTRRARRGCSPPRSHRWPTRPREARSPAISGSTRPPPASGAAASRLLLLLLVFLHDHGPRVWRQAGAGRPSHACVVPSGRGRPARTRSRPWSPPTSRFPG